MAAFPKIDSPCPLKLKALPRAGADFCGRCSRRVHDLTGMDASQRRAFMSGCGDAKVCVAYTLPMPRARAAGLGIGVGLLAALATAPVLASDPLAPALQSPAIDAVQPLTTTTQKICLDDLAAAQAADDEIDTEIIEYVVVGGVDRADEAEWSDDGESLLAELPRAGAEAFLDEEGIEFGPAPR